MKITVSSLRRNSGGGIPHRTGIKERSVAMRKPLLITLMTLFWLCGEGCGEGEFDLRQQFLNCTYSLGGANRPQCYLCDILLSRMSVNY